MDHDQVELMAEEEYLSEAIYQVEILLSKEIDKNTDSRDSIVSAQKEMWEDSELYSNNEFERLLAISQSFEPISLQISSYESSANKISILNKMRDNTYFARVDFAETGHETEKIYIGRANVIDEADFIFYVYDWRAPICSIFYRFELGEVHYDAPMGRIDGNVSLKRQYEVKNGRLEYFFDANINISDEFLRKMLSENTSPKMKAIVETIQRNQDIIIRDMENDLLIVQGIAGSGKTSVALHRVAYLMYQGLSAKLRAGDILILSPNHLFSRYISEVLPELGETRIESLIFEELCKTLLAPASYPFQTRNEFFEVLITCEDNSKKELMKSSIEFKTSNIFIQILARFIDSFERHIEFEDIYYDETCIFDKQFLCDFILTQGTRMTLAKRLKYLEQVIFEKVREMRKKRIKKLEAQVLEQGDHALEIGVFARLLSIQESTALLDRIHQFTEIDYLKCYQHLFENKALFDQLAEGLILPEHIDNIRNYTLQSIKSCELLYEDILALSYLKTRLVGLNEYSHFKQVVIDEAQDYYPIHFELVKQLFTNAKYTILGDMNQTIEKNTDFTIYDEIRMILNKKKSTIVSMNKSFRCTNEILEFSGKFIDDISEFESFNRHGSRPTVQHFDNASALDEALISEINESKELRYGSIGILCKSNKQAHELQTRLGSQTQIKRIDSGSGAISGVFIIPVYMAKGLEFDSVLIYGMNSGSSDEAEKKLLYIACTRALHRLSLFDI